MHVVSHTGVPCPNPNLLPSPAQEFYGDFMVLDSHHFTIPCAKNELLICPEGVRASGQARE